MNDRPSSTRRLTRRGLLTTAAGGISALALHHAMSGGFAFAAQKPAVGKKLTKQQHAELKTKVPQATDVTLSDTKLTPEQAELARLLLQRSKHAIALAAANPRAKFQPGSLHAVAAAVLARQPKKRSDRAKQRAAKLLADPTAGATEFGTYLKATLSSATVKQAPDVKIVAAARALQEAERKRSQPKHAQADLYSKIQFHLNTVECLATTDGGGADEIMLSGYLVTPDGVKTIDNFKVSDDFDEGETKYFDYEACEFLADLGQTDGMPASLCPHGGPDDVYKGRVLANASLKPGTYTLVTMMGEEDDGTVEEMLKKAYAAAKEEINAAIESGSAGVGGIAGSFIPIPGLGTAVGALVGWLTGKLVEFFASLVDDKDDFVAARSWSVTFEHKTQYYVDGLTKNHLPAPKGTRASEMKKLGMNGDGGRYLMRLHWRALAA